MISSAVASRCTRYLSHLDGLFLARGMRDSATPPTHHASLALKEARRNLHFFARATYIFSAYKIFETRTNVAARITGADAAAVDRAWAHQHEWGGEQLYRMACDMKGFHLKGAQWLGARPDICPKEWCVHLSKLQDRCPQMPLSEVRGVVERELGTELESAFASFDAEPIGSASIAQVHVARLRSKPTGWRRAIPLLRRATSKAVAVKVQRPGVEAQMLGDLRNLRAFFSVGVVKKGLAWDTDLVIDQVEGETRLEFDFFSEARFMHLAHRLVHGTRSRFMPWPLARPPPVSVPRPIEGLSTRRCLVMELLPGLQLSRLGAESSAAWASERESARARRAGRQLMTKLGSAYGLMLFDAEHGGLVHADPHPGNILVSRRFAGGVRVGLVDWGQSKRLTLAQQLRLAAVVDALCAAGDFPGRARSAEVMRSYRNLGILWNSSLPIEAEREAAAAAATDAFDSITLPTPFTSDPTTPTYPLAVLGGVSDFPTDLIYFFRATQILRALTQHLGLSDEVSIAQEWGPHARRLLRKRGRDPRNWRLPDADQGAVVVREAS